MFLGEFEYKVDAKGRVPIPPKYRRLLRDEVVLTQGIEKCITAYPVSEWKKLAATLTTSSITPSKVRKLNRAIFATAFTILIDRQGRVALASPLRQHAEIEDDVVVAGANTYFEIWNKANWEAEKAESSRQAWQIIESLERH